MHDVGRTMDGKRLVALADGELQALVTIRGRLTALRADMDALLDGLPGVLMTPTEPRPVVPPAEGAAVNGGGATGSKAKGKPKKGGKVARSGKRRASPGGVVTVRKADVAALLGDEPLPVKVLYERFLVAKGADASPVLFTNFGKCISMASDVAERVSRGVYRRRGASPAAAAAASPAAGPTPAPAVSGSGRALKAEKAAPPAMDRAARLPLLKEVDARVRARHEGGERGTD